MPLVINRDYRLKVIVKSADETVNNSDVLQDDDDLKFTAIAGVSYALFFILYHISPAAQDIKLQLNTPGGVGETGGVMWLSEVGAHHFANINASYTMSTAGTADIMSGHATLNVGATAGEVVLSWAQATAGVADTKILKGSSLVVIRQ